MIFYNTVVYYKMTKRKLKPEYKLDIKGYNDNYIFLSKVNKEDDKDSCLILCNVFESTVEEIRLGERNMCSSIVKVICYNNELYVLYNLDTSCELGTYSMDGEYITSYDNKYENMKVESYDFIITNSSIALNADSNILLLDIKTGHKLQEFKICDNVGQLKLFNNKNNVYVLNLTTSRVYKFVTSEKNMKCISTFLIDTNINCNPVSFYFNKFYIADTSKDFEINVSIYDDNGRYIKNIHKMLFREYHSTYRIKYYKSFFIMNNAYYIFANNKLIKYYDNGFVKLCI